MVDVTPRFKTEPEPKKQRTMIVLRCDACSTLFKRRSDFKPRNPEGAILCNPCSRRARSTGRTYPSRRTGRDVVCSVCGKTFYRVPSRIVSAELFCSPKCRGTAVRGVPRTDLYFKSQNAGEKNGRYVHGKRVGDNTSSRRQVRADVAERDGDWCLLCGKPPPGLHLHRVRYGSQGGKYEFGNCMQLCHGHHMLVHRSKRDWQQELLAYLADPTEARRVRLRGFLSGKGWEQ